MPLPLPSPSSEANGDIGMLLDLIMSLAVSLCSSAYSVAPQQASDKRPPDFQKLKDNATLTIGKQNQQYDHDG